jgi:hypothetical protein
MKRLRFALAAAVFSCSTMFAADPGLLSLVPADAKTIGGMNVDSAANSPFGRFLLSRMKQDDASFSRFVAATGFDPRLHLREVIFAGTGPLIPGERNVGFAGARGVFNAAQILNAAKLEGAATTAYKGIELLKNKSDSSVMAILDSTTAVAGDEAIVKRAIDQRGTASQLDPKTLAKVNDISARFDIWLVSTGPVSNFAGAAPSAAAGNVMKNPALQAIEQTSGGVRFGTMIEFVGEAVARTEKDAQSLVDVIRFITGLMQMNKEKSAEAARFAKLLDGMETGSTGNTVHLMLSIPQSDVEQLMKSKKVVKRAAVRQ